MKRDAEAARERAAVAPVAVEQLDDARGLAERADPLLHPVPVDRVDQPDLAVEHERVRAALQDRRLGRDPADAPLLLVAEANVHQAASRPSITRTASGFESIRT